MYLQETIDEHLENYDPDNLKDYIDYYINDTGMDKKNESDTFKDDCNEAYLSNNFDNGIWSIFILFLK